MAHPQQRAYMESVRDRFPFSFNYEEHLTLDVGSFDINGSNRDLFSSPHTVIGVDVTPGPGVDIVSPCHLLTFRDGYFSTIVSSEAFEHDAYLPLTLQNIVRMLAPGGLFAFTCATTGRGEHGTIISKPHDAPGLPWWHYRNVTEAHMRLLLDWGAIFSEYEFRIGHETCDLYGYGVKR